MKHKETLGSIIKERRLEMDLTATALAKQIGISLTYLCRIENDTYPTPSEQIIVDIAKVIGECPDKLLSLGGHVSSDLIGIIMACPREISAFLRLTKEQKWTKSNWIDIIKENSGE